MSTRLLEHCEPLFQAVCRLNRMGRKGSSIDYAHARAEIAELLDRMAKSSRTDVALSEQYAKVELPLIFFVDSIIAESALPFAAEWGRNRLAEGRKELAGDEKFFDLLDETLQDPSDGASERLAVFFTCLGLGFSGWYAGQPEMLRKKMLELSPRVKAYVDFDDSGLITPDAYKSTNTSNLPLPAASSIVPLLIVFVGLFLAVVAFNFYTFRAASAELKRTFDAIVAHDPALKAPPQP
ncbi:MAG: DotU family type IV/VI secretion system protein [Opitutaceae bacterium]